MSLVRLSQEQIKRTSELQKSSYRPHDIIELQRQIEAETRATELKVSINAIVDPADVQKIVRMKIELDGLYLLWIEGKID